jgi:hypothetical protein
MLGLAAPGRGYRGRAYRGNAYRGNAYRGNAAPLPPSTVTTQPVVACAPAR